MTYLIKTMLMAALLGSHALLVSSIFVINANALPASVTCSVQILDTTGTNSQGVEIGMQIGEGTEAEQLIQLTCTYMVQDSSQGSSQGSAEGLLHYYLRRRAATVPSDGGTFSAFNAQTGKYWPDSATVADWTLEPFIAWLLPLGLDSQSQPGVHDYQQPPGLVLLRDGLLNGTLPINATHMASIESLKLLSADVPAERNHRISVYQMRSHLDRWKQLLGRDAQTGRNAERLHQQIRTELKLARHEKRRSKLIRVRRQQSKYDDLGRENKWSRKPPEERIPFKDVKVKFNLETNYLTRKGPYVIKVHLHLDLAVKENMNGNKEAMIKKAKEVVNFANSLLRPFNAYILVSSLHLPLSESDKYGKLYNFKGDPIQFSRKEYYRIEAFVNYEHVDCVYIFMGKAYAQDTVSDSATEMCGSMSNTGDRLLRNGCVGYVVFDTNRPDHVKISGFALAHEVAQSLSCGHDVDSDPKEKCECRFPKCVMETHAETMPDSLPIGWSSCSIKRLVEGLDGKDNNGKNCLRPKSTGDEVFITQYSTEWGSTCGNGVVEPGEDCDCGSARACKANRCCKQCRLASGAKCAVGSCCDLKTCAPSAKDQVCRGVWDPRCDFPEVCDGASTVCPGDVMVSSAWTCKSIDPASARVAHVCKNGVCSRKTGGDKYSGPNCTADNVPLTNGKCLPKPVFKVEDVQGVRWPSETRATGAPGAGPGDSNDSEGNESANRNNDGKRRGAGDDDKDDDGARLVGASAVLVATLQSLALLLLRKACI